MTHTRNICGNPVLITFSFFSTPFRSLPFHCSSVLHTCRWCHPSNMHSADTYSSLTCPRASGADRYYYEGRDRHLSASLRYFTRPALFFSRRGERRDDGREEEDGDGQWAMWQIDRWMCERDWERKKGDKKVDRKTDRKADKETKICTRQVAANTCTIRQVQCLDREQVLTHESIDMTGK